MIAAIGEACGLAAAGCWATASLLFHRVRVPPAAINLFKNALCGLLLALTFALIHGGFALETDATVLWLLLSSAIAGLVIGDTCHFACLQVLGPRRCLILQTLAPPLALACGFLALDERLSRLDVAGAAITLCGVILVILERAPVGSVGEIDGTTRLRGVAFGVLAAAGQAIGATLSTLAIRRMEDAAAMSPALQASILRLVMAAGLGLLIALVHRRVGIYARAVRAPARLLIPASLIGSYGGIWLSMLAFQHAGVGVASTLTATSPVLVLPLAAVFLKERIGWRAVTGALLALAGVALLFAD